MPKGLIRAAALVLVIAACGGATDTGDTAGSPEETVTSSSTSSAPSTEETTTTASSEEAPSGSPDPGTGYVTLDGETYDFDLTTQCQIEGESMAVSGPLADGSDGSVEGIFPSPDQQEEFGPYHVLVVFGDSDTWIAHEGYEPTLGEPPTPEESAVTDASLVGSSISGEGVFWNTGSGDTATGSFAFTCP